MTTFAGRSCAAWTCATLSLGLGAPAFADSTDPASRPPLTAPQTDGLPPPPLHKWDGNATGVVIGPTMAWLDRVPAGLAAQGLGVHAALRMSFIAQFLDAELLLDHDRYAGAAGLDGGLTRTAVGFQGALHPGFPLVVFNDFLNDIAAGVHGYFGLQMVRLSLPDGARMAQTDGTTSDWRPGVTVGVGLDVPVSPRDRGSGWWLTGRYEGRWVWFGDHNPDLPLGDTRALVLLGWRYYDTNWARLGLPWR